jgi:hypothetical protein
MHTTTLRKKGRELLSRQTVAFFQHDLLDRKLFAPLCTAVAYHTLTSRGTHAHQEAVRCHTLSLFGLIGSFWHTCINTVMSADYTTPI